MDRRAGNRKPYARCLVLAASAIEAYGQAEARFAYAHIDPEGFSLRRWLVMYEALFRERMAPEQEDEFDELLDEASGIEHVHSTSEKAGLMLDWGGDMVTD